MVVQYVVIFSYFTRLSSSSASIVSTNCRWELLAEGERMCNRKKNSDESGNRLMKIKQFCIPPRLWAHKKIEWNHFNLVYCFSFIIDTPTRRIHILKSSCVFQATHSFETNPDCAGRKLQNVFTFFLPSLHCGDTVCCESHHTSSSTKNWNKKRIHLTRDS